MPAKDENQIAHSILLQATLIPAQPGETPQRRLERLGGFKAGTARAARHTTEQIAEMARKGRRKG
jgi:hypothetical protein